MSQSLNQPLINRIVKSAVNLSFIQYGLLFNHLLKILQKWGTVNSTSDYTCQTSPVHYQPYLLHHKAQISLGIFDS
jgi:hypothetical protein